MTEIFKIALKSLYNNKLRSFLSSLGIIIGVATIVLVIAIGTGAQKAIEKQYANLAVTSIMVNASKTSELNEDDILKIKEQAQYISISTALLLSRTIQVSDSSNSLSLGMLGVGKDFLEISNLEIEKGRYFDDIEIEERSKYVVLGNGASLDFFGTTKDVVGRTINVGRKKLEIIGVFKQSGTSMGPITYDDSIYTSYKMGELLIGSNKGPKFIMLANDVDSIDLAIDEVTEILRESHKLKANDPSDFRVVDQGSKVVAAKESSSTMNMLLTGVAIIVLVVSGIGIMNVMFAGVAERTKEIGILRAIGIKTGDILNIFLFESIILSIGGGIVGIALGEGLMPLITYFDLIEVYGSLLGDIGAFFFAVFVGIFFGYYPAYKASKMDPVDALRN